VSPKPPQGGFFMPDNTTYLQRQARATVVRNLIRNGHVDPWIGLSYLIWPTPEILEAERKVAASTLHARVYRDAWERRAA
jgi:hypothetical protein